MSGIKSRQTAEQELGGRVIAGQLGRYRVEGTGWLGGGSSANVFLAMNEYNMQRVAVKAIDRYQIEESARKRELLTRELNIASKLKHPNIINLMEVIFDENYVMLIMELATGGELYNAVKDGAMAESRAQWVFHQICSALDYCHSKGVCHRDLKLENLMLLGPTPGNLGTQELVKVTDFGLSKDCSMHSQPHTKVGTISYMAPEVTEANNAEPYDGQAADVWSLGVILYVLVSCSYPFGYDGPKELGGEPTHKVCTRIREGRFTPPPPSLSEACQGLIAGMLTVDPKARLSVRQVLDHPWLRDVEAAHGRVALSASVSAAAAAGLDAVTWPGGPDGGGGEAGGGAAPPPPVASEDDGLNDALAGDDDGEIRSNQNCRTEQTRPAGAHHRKQVRLPVCAQLTRLAGSLLALAGDDLNDGDVGGSYSSHGNDDDDFSDDDDDDDEMMRSTGPPVSQPVR